MNKKDVVLSENPRLAIEWYTMILKDRQAHHKGQDHVDVNDCMYKLALSQIDAGLYNEALQWLHKALDMRLRLMRQHIDQFDVHVVFLIYLLMSECCKRTGNHQKAIEIDVMVAKVLQDANSKDNIATILFNQAESLSQAGQLSKAIQIHKDQLAFDKEGQPDKSILAWTALGRCYKDAGRYGQALDMFDQAYNGLLMAKSGSDQDLNAMITLIHDVANCYVKMSQFQDAFQWFNKCLDMLYKKHGGDQACHPEITACLNDLALAHDENGDTDKATELYEECLQMAKALGSQNSLDLAKTINNLALCHEEHGQWQTALDMHYKSLAMKEKTPDLKSRATSWNNIGICLLNLGDPRAAIGVHKKCLAMRMEQVYTDWPDHPDIAQSYTNLGNAYRVAGQLDLALECHTKSLEMEQTIHKDNPNHHNVAISIRNLACVHEDQGDYDQAIELNRDYLNKTKANFDLNHKKVMEATTWLANCIFLQYWDQGLAPSPLMAEVLTRLPMTLTHIDPAAIIQTSVKHCAIANGLDHFKGGQVIKL